MKTVNLNPIITDIKYIGLSDDDPRLAELANRLISIMEAQHFDNEIILVFKEASKSMSYIALETAIDQLYDYADKNEIWLGKLDDVPADLAG